MNWLSAKKRASECIKASSIQLTTRNYFWHTKKIYLCLHCFAKIRIAGGKKHKRAEHSEPCRVVFKALQLSRKTWIFALTDNAHGETLTTERNLEKKRSRVERKPDLCSTKRSFCLPPVDTWPVKTAVDALYSRRGHVTVLTPSQPTVSRYYRHGWMCVHAWNDSGWFSISHSVWFLRRSLPVSPRRSLPLLRKDELQTDKSAFF